jgi:type I restriction enzyme, S subunit
MGNYQAYEKYKDSGVEWLGEIPEHWKALKGKFIFEILSGYAPADFVFDDKGIKYYQVDDLNDTSSVFMLDKSSKYINVNAMSSKLIINAPFILFPKRGAAIATNKVKIISENSLFDTNLMGLKTNRLSNDKFIAYAIFSRGLWDIADVSTIPQINNKHINPLFFPFPPRDEQELIAKFLDHKTKQIDDLIAKKEALLSKLDEKRSAIISHAVTKGLDPTVPMKDSGVEWLGDIPQHWNIAKMKFISNIKYGLGEPPEQLDDGLPIIRATDIYRGIIDGSKVQRVNPDKVPWSRNPELKSGDILVVRSGAYTGDSAIVTDEWAGAIAGYDMVITPTTLYPKYIAWNLLSKHVLEGQLHLAKSRAAQPHLNAEELGNTILATPLLTEQEEIAKYLDQKTAEINLQKAKVQEAIERLKEYRTALITNAVTGKIDIRHVPLN